MVRKFFPIVVLLALGSLGWDKFELGSLFENDSGTNADVFTQALRDHQSGLQVDGSGVVARVLADDNDGSRHQRFLLELSSGQTLLVAHNIDLAPRIASLREGDSVRFNGVYEWNSKGGVIHWTHRDPGGRHEPGWLEHQGRIYQ